MVSFHAILILQRKTRNRQQNQGGTQLKFFHLSDLHIGLKLMNRDLKEDQEYILQQITDIAEYSGRF